MTVVGLHICPGRQTVAAVCGDCCLCSTCLIALRLKGSDSQSVGKRRIEGCGDKDVGDRDTRGRKGRCVKEKGIGEGKRAMEGINQIRLYLYT